VLAPAGTPRDVTSRLDGEIKSVLGLEEVRKLLATQGVEADYQGQAEFARFVAAEIAHWSRVVQQGNIKLE
jgi:tripartite-type tricarboxylate transporter receptor subunit TctC